MMMVEHFAPSATLFFVFFLKITMYIYNHHKFYLCNIRSRVHFPSGYLVTGDFFHFISIFEVFVPFLLFL